MLCFVAVLEAFAISYPWSISVLHIPRCWTKGSWLGSLCIVVFLLMQREKESFSYLICIIFILVKIVILLWCKGTMDDSNLSQGTPFHCQCISTLMPSHCLRNVSGRKLTLPFAFLLEFYIISIQRKCHFVMRSRCLRNVSGTKLTLPFVLLLEFYARDWEKF